MNTIHSLIGAAVDAPLQLEPPVREALSNPLLSSSLWIMIALMGVALVLFTYMGRNVEDSRIKLILVATIGIPAVSISSYFGLASGLTIGIFDVAGRGDVVTLWGRYLTWTFSTPLILLALGLLAGSNPTKIGTAIVFDVLMCVTGLAAVVTTQAVWMRWFWFVLSSAFFLVVLYVLLIEWPKDAAQQDGDIQELFGTLRTLTAVLWVGYPVVWALGSEGIVLFGSGVMGLAITSWLYSLLDVGAKFVFAFLLVRFLADEPESARSGAATGRATVADD
jgi:halorhodopsin